MINEKQIILKMIKIMLIIIAAQIVVLTVKCVNSQSTLEDKSELKENPSIRNYENLTQVDQILDLFSIGEIGLAWTQLYKRLSTPCAQNMMEYLSGLEQKEIWAMKSKCCRSAVDVETEKEWKLTKFHFQL